MDKLYFLIKFSFIFTVFLPSYIVCCFHSNNEFTHFQGFSNNTLFTPGFLENVFTPGFLKKGIFTPGFLENVFTTGFLENVFTPGFLENVFTPGFLENVFLRQDFLKMYLNDRVS